MIAAGLVLIAALYYGLAPEGGGSTPTKRTARPKAATSKADPYRPEDYRAKFAPLNLETRDVFKPLIVREDRSTGRTTTPTLDGGIPAAFAGGDSNWQYKGYAVVDGKVQGLLENGATGEGIFVSPGERWRAARVLTITRDSIVMQGNSGAARSIPIVDDEAAIVDRGSVALAPLPVPAPTDARAARRAARQAARNGAALDASASPSSTTTLPDGPIGEAK